MPIDERGLAAGATAFILVAKERAPWSTGGVCNVHSDGDLAEIEVRTLGSAGHGQTVTCVEEKTLPLGSFLDLFQRIRVGFKTEVVDRRETKN